MLLLLAACAPADRLPAERTVSVEGVRVAYERVGESAEALVFLHGWASDRSVWSAQRPAPDGHAAVYVDLPGHGASDAPEREYSMPFLASAVHAILRQEELARVVLVAHSNGFPVAREVVRAHPERVAAIVSIEGSLRALTADPARQERFLDLFRGPDWRENVKRVVPPLSDDELRGRLEAMMLATPQHVLVGTLAAMFDPTIWDDGPLPVPTLVIVAESPQWTDEFAVWVGTFAPDSRYEVRRGASHFLMMEPAHAPWVNQTIGNFLATRRVFASQGRGS